MIGFFDSGVGGLTIIEEVHKLIPEYDTIYLGDTKRAPYGNRSYEELVQFTIEGCDWLFKNGCELIIIACNSSSAGALREIQQGWLIKNHPEKRILGIIRPTVEKLASLNYKQIGIFSTIATAKSGAYEKEFSKINPNINIISHSCPKWAGMIEQGLLGTSAMEMEVDNEVKKFEKEAGEYDSILLACTHYPYIKDEVKKYLSKNVPIFNQGDIVADSLKNYLGRHKNIEGKIAKHHERKYFVTGDEKMASNIATSRFGFNVVFKNISL